jgi:tetratricopeptide (TPR) repeat protein
MNQTFVALVLHAGNMTLRKSAFNGIIVVGVLIAAHLFIGRTASARQSQNWTWCTNNGKQFSPGLEISGCTAVIHSGQETRGNLAIAYYNRGTLYFRKKDYDRAIQDYDQATRLNPQHANAFNGRCLVRAIFGRELRQAVAEIVEPMKGSLR